MIHWKETAEILSRLAELEAAGRRAALATVVRIAGSAYRRAGAKFLIEEDGETLGSVSGGCLEADVREVGLGVLAGGEPRLLRYDTGSDEDAVWGLGLGCDGTVEVFVQAATGGPVAELAPRLRRAARRRRGVRGRHRGGRWRGRAGAGPPAVVSGAARSARGAWARPELDPRPGAARARARPARGSRRSTLDPVGDRALFFDVLQPPRHLLVFGAGDDARPLVVYAADAGFRVTVVDHRPGLLADGRFPGAQAAVHARSESGRTQLAQLTPARAPAFAGGGHDPLAAPRPSLGAPPARRRRALRRPARPARPHRALLAEIGSEGDRGSTGRSASTSGADGPRQVAISIVAELLAVTNGREPRHLSARREAIHAG